MRVNSFDVFDTLIARRCIEPGNIFLQIERKTGITHFAMARRRAEASVASGNYTLDDIYKALQQQSGLSTDQAEQLKQLEIAEEVDNAIPITENLQRVRNGDLLISDMYLPPAVIRQMLDKCGLDKEVTLIVTSGGKSSGQIWKHFDGKVELDIHTGDNAHSDVHSPLSSGIFGRHTQLHSPSSYEKFLIDNGLPRLGRLVRELRLKMLDASRGMTTYKEMELQIGINIPILMMAATAIHHLAQTQQADRILFCSRDCYYMFRIHQALFGGQPGSVPAAYFYTSRHARVKASPAYLAYVRQMVSDRSLVVDLCGTGWSLGELYAKAGLQPMTMLMNYMPGSKMYDGMGERKPIDKIHFLNHDIDANNAILEALNYTDHGMVEDVVHIDEYNAFVPLLEDPHYPHGVLRYIHVIQETHRALMNLLPAHEPPALQAEILSRKDLLPRLVEILSIDVKDKVHFLPDVAHYHVGQDQKSMWRLQKLTQSSQVR